MGTQIAMTQETKREMMWREKKRHRFICHTLKLLTPVADELQLLSALCSALLAGWLAGI
jgi:hypothetical protein